MAATQRQDEHPPIEPRWLMPLLDVGLIFLAWVIGYILRYDWQVFRPVFDPSRAGFAPYLPYAALYTAMLLFIYHNSNLYRMRRGRSLFNEGTIIANGVTNATVILLAFYFLLQPLVTSRLMLVYVAAFTFLLLTLSRFIRRIILAYLRTKGIGVQRVLIAGMGEVGQAVLRTLVSRSELGYKVVGYLDDDPQRGEIDLGRVSGLGKLGNLTRVVRAHGIDVLIITLRWTQYDEILALARTAKRLGVEIRVVPDIFQLNLRQVNVENLDGIPLLGINVDSSLTGA
ncbi:MAG: hypothetical protein KC496_08585, partial [Anaerolineae bacterium]|nr:hypothetical protein [Anaerolineae bacterium]